ncbi:MAG: FKBP-type peptidyl-prolyl cis-trans isomerase [Candidatus Woesearchaeota archaeon]
MTQVKQGDWISVAYEGTLKDGTVFDKSDDFVFEVGAGKVIKGFDTEVQSMNVDDEKTFTIPSAEAYGEESDNQKETVPKSFFQNVEKVDIGMQFMAQTPMGPLKVKVLTIDGDNVSVSLNHPLAGEDLTFKLKVTKVLSEEEVATRKEEEQKKYEEMMKQQQAMQAQQQGSGCGCGSGGCGDGSCGSDDCGCNDEETTQDTKTE